MKKHLTVLHLLMASAMLASVAFGMSDRRKQTAPTPTNTSTLDLATGQLTTSDYSGQSQSAAGNSRIADTRASTVGGKFADKSDPTMELAWFDINRAAEDQPDVAIDLQLANEHKSAVESLKTTVASGNPSVAALNLATEGLKVVKEKIAAREREKAARGKADTSAFRATAYLQGPGAVTSVALMAGTMGTAVANGNEKRATFTSDINSKVTDTTNTNDWSGSATILRHQLELAKIDLEMAKIKAASQKAPETGTGKPPVVKPTEPKPEDPVTPPPADGSTPPPLSKALSELQKLYPGAKPGGDNNKEADWTTNGNKLQWKNDSDQNGRAVVIVPFYVGATGVQVTHAGGTETATGIRNNSYGNGLRVTFQLDSTGSAYRSPVTVKLLPSGATYSVPNPGKNEGIARLKWPTFSAAPVEPVDPPPSGDTSAAPAGGKTHELTSIGLLLRADVAATVSHVIVIEDAETNRENPPKIAATRIGNTWTTGKPLSQHRAAVYQVWFAAPPPAPVTYHPDFLGRGPVGHVTQAGLWNPDTIR